MACSLEKVVPWGRSLREYSQMFALSNADLKARILGCADGPASFNAETTCVGGSVISCDPIYAFSAKEIRSQIELTSPKIIEYARTHVEEFVWSEAIPDPDALAEHRMQAMSRFLTDYDAGLSEGRYVAAEVPSLPFSDDSFDLALCSHFLFLYSEQLSERFHIESIYSLMRVAKEARIFPLLSLGGKTSVHKDAVMSAMRDEGYKVDIEVVEYEFQRGANQMMRIRR